MNQIIAAAKDFIADVVRSPDDRFFLMTFAARTRATGWLKREQLSGISLEVKLEGATTLYDSLVIACRDRLGPRDWNKPTRRILIIISDGEDNQSHVSEAQAISEALHSGAVIFAVDTLTVASQKGRGDRIMQHFAEASGGRLIADFTSKEISKVFQQMKLINEGMYYARYFPPISNNKLHEVEVKPAPQEKLRISYPKRYEWVQ